MFFLQGRSSVQTAAAQSCCFPGNALSKQPCFRPPPTQLVFQKPRTSRCCSPLLLHRHCCNTQHCFQLSPLLGSPCRGAALCTPLLLGLIASLVLLSHTISLPTLLFLSQLAFPEEQSVSCSLKDLLSRLLDKNPARRITLPVSG